MSRGGTRVRYDKLVPPDTFIHDYLTYMEAQETPYAYDFWTATWLLSVAVGRAVVVDRPRAAVHLNTFIILVAESGITRKSSSVRNATSFARPLCKVVPELIEAKITPEYLEQRLHGQSVEHGHCGFAISVSELATFLGREKYNRAMPTLLTDLYDCPEYRTGGGTMEAKRTGGRDMQNVYLSFLSASTPAWLLRTVNPDVIEGGFTSRVLFVVETKPKKLQPWPENIDDTHRDTITARLRGIRSEAANVPRIAISEGGRKVFDKWYRTRTISRDAFRSSFQSREDAHVLRTAAFLCINDGTWHIQHNHVLAAIKIVTQVREDGAAVFAGTGHNSRVVLGIDRVREKLLAAGLNGLPQRKLTAMVQTYDINAERLQAILGIMHEMEMVQKFENIQVSRGRPVTIWRATSLLGQSRALDKVIEAYAPD